MNDEPFPMPVRPAIPPMPHTDLIRLIGEVDGISLRGCDGRMEVLLRIHGKEIQVIQDFMESPDHHITREGIRDMLSRNLL